MSASGFEILDDDSVLDVYEDYLARFDNGEEHAAIREELVAAWTEFHGNPVDGHLFWFALAEAQWECGVLEQDVLDRVEAFIAEGVDLRRWAPHQIEPRRLALDRFLNKLRVPRAKPRRRRVKRKRRAVPAIYQVGDCLSLRLSDGQFAAAIVLGAVDSDEEEDGSNFLGLIRYHSPEPPTLEAFQNRKWLRLTHHKCGGALAQAWCPARAHKKDAAKISLVGHVDLGPDDPQPTTLFVPYATEWYLGEHVVWQDRWDQGIRE